MKKAIDVVHIEPGQPDDLDPMLSLLAANGLPIDGVRDILRSSVVARQNGRLVGMAAIEIYPEGGLLRSVAVDQALRGTGVGIRLARAAIDAARTLRLPALYLLTATAEGFFPKFGFERITRAGVPPSVLASVEFATACPASATVMVKRL
jgi:amino-acid N-acetyltransferase